MGDERRTGAKHELAALRQRVAELEAREREHEFARMCFDLAGVILVMLGADERVLMINAKGCELLGYPRDEIVGKNWFDHFIPTHARERVRQGFRELIAGNVEPVARFENPVLTRTGEERMIAWQNTVIRNERGEITATLSSGEDVTARRHAEEAQRKSEATARALLEAASEGIVIVNANGRIVGVNRKTEEMFGYSRDELVGETVELLLPERFRGSHLAHRLSYFSEPRVRPMGRGLDLAGLRKDGSEFPVEISLSYTRLEDGLVAMAFITDITQRKQAERRLQAQFAVTEALAESATLADAIPRILRALCDCLGWELGEMWSVDPESGVLRWKGSWRAPGLDASAFEAISRDMSLPPGTGLPGRVVTSGGPVWIADLASAMPPDVSFVRAAAAARIGLRAAVGFPILIGHRVTGVMVFFNRELHRPDDDVLKMMADIGSRIGQYIEHKRVQGELERQREALHQSEKLAAIGTLSAGLTHEINNPLGIITARIDVMMEEAEAYRLPEELREDLAVLRRNAQRVARIAQGLLSFARQTPGKRVSLDLNHVVEDTLLLVEKQAAKEGITVVRELAHDLPPVLGNANQLQQVLLNLINNAREAMANGGTITIATEPAPNSAGGVRLRVSDTGPGIPAEHLPKLFDPFFTTKPGGTGLGLSVTYGIVKDHEGILEVHSEVGKGTTFTVILPAPSGQGQKA